MTPLRMKDTAGTEFPLRSRITTPNLPLAILVPGKAAITAICLEVGGLGRSRRDQAQVDFAHFQVQPPSISASLPSPPTTLPFISPPSLPQLVQQDERGL